MRPIGNRREQVAGERIEVHAAMKCDKYYGQRACPCGCKQTHARMQAKSTASSEQSGERLSCCPAPKPASHVHRLPSIVRPPPLGVSQRLIRRLDLLEALPRGAQARLIRHLLHRSMIAAGAGRKMTVAVHQGAAAAPLVQVCVPQQECPAGEGCC